MEIIEAGRRRTQEGLSHLHEQLSTYFSALYFQQNNRKACVQETINFIDKHNILYVNHFGFREKHSTMHATLPLCMQLLYT